MKLIGLLALIPLGLLFGLALQADPPGPAAKRLAVTDPVQPLIYAGSGGYRPR